MGQARASTENPAGCRRWCPFGARDGAGGGEPRVELLEELGVAAPGSCRWRRRGGRRQAVGAWWTPGTGWQGPGKQRKLEGAGPGDRRDGTGAGGELRDGQGQAKGRPAPGRRGGDCPGLDGLRRPRMRDKGGDPNPYPSPGKIVRKWPVK